MILTVRCYLVLEKVAFEFDGNSQGHKLLSDFIHVYDRHVCDRQFGCSVNSHTCVYHSLSYSSFVGHIVVNGCPQFLSVCVCVIYDSGAVCAIIYQFVPK